MRFSSEQLYDSRLRADESVATHTLSELEGVSSSAERGDDNDEESLGSYESDALAPLLFIDTADCEMYEGDPSLADDDSDPASKSAKCDIIAGGRDADEDESKSNAGEVALVVRHVKLLVARGVKPKDIGVLSPYNGYLMNLFVCLFFCFLRFFSKKKNK